MENSIYTTKDNLEYRIKFSKKAKHLAILVDSDCGVFIRVPSRKSFFVKSAIERMIENNHNRILKFVQRKKEKNAKAVKLQFSETINIKGHDIIFIPSTEKSVKIQHGENNTRVFCPDVERDLIIQKITKPIREILFRLSESYIIPRMHEISKLHGLKFNRCRIRHVRTIWGSCSKDNNITISSKLIALEDKYIDYVITHELLHTKYKHHKPIFFASLTKLLSSDAKTLDKQINKQKHPIFEVFNKN